MRSCLYGLALATPAPSGRVSVSIGVGSTEMMRADTTEALLAGADAALYEAKRGGRNVVHVAMAA